MRVLESKSRIIRVRLPRFKRFTLTLIVAIPWLIVLGLLLTPFLATHSDHSNSVILKPGGTKSDPGPTGPWGALKICDIVIEPPAEYISPNYFSQVNPWVLKNVSEAQLIQELKRCAFSEAQQSKALSCADFSNSSNVVITPDNELMFGLSPDQRRDWYAVLEKYPENKSQMDPFIFKPNELDEWLTKSKISAATVANIKRLLYPHGNTVLLSDCHWVTNNIEKPEDRVQLLKTLLRRSTFLLKVKIKPDSDVEQLVKYWGREGREKDVRPILESATRSRSEISLDVALLLPRFARDRIYTFPTPEAADIQGKHDCHWSALNFFNDAPDDNVVSAENFKTTLNGKYFPVPAEPEFGDLVLFLTPTRQLIHSAIYIADDILFTKNGPSHTSPWILMHKNDVRNDYPAYDNLEALYFRLKR